MMKKNLFSRVLFLFFVTMLAGCVSEPVKQDMLALSLKDKAVAINRQLPVSEHGVVLVRATAEEHQLTLKLYQSEAGQDMNVVMQNYGTYLCLQPDVKARIMQGARYSIEGTDVSGKAHERTIKTC